jgi:hypothetical protein
MPRYTDISVLISSMHSALSTRDIPKRSESESDRNLIDRQLHAPCLIRIENAYDNKSCFELAIFNASTIVLKPSKERTSLQFSIIQCSWCSGDVVSANVPGKGHDMRDEADQVKCTLKNIHEPSGVCDLCVPVL